MTPIPILGVPDVQAARDYFVDVLGFTCTGFHKGGDEAVYAIVARDGGEVHLQIRRGTLPTTREAHETDAYVLVADVDALHAELVGEVDMLRDIRDEPYGMRDFTIELPFGPRIAFAMPLEGAT